MGTFSIFRDGGRTLVAMMRLGRLLGVADLSEGEIEHAALSKIVSRARARGFLILPGIFGKETLGRDLVTLLDVPENARDGEKNALSPGYPTAHLLVQLSVALSLRDGKFARAQLVQLSRFLENMFRFTSLDIRALSCLKDFCIALPPDVARMSLLLASPKSPVPKRASILLAKMAASVAASEKLEEPGNSDDDEPLICSAAVKALCAALSVGDEEIFEIWARTRAEGPEPVALELIAAYKALRNEGERTAVDIDMEKVATLMEEDESLAPLWAEIFRDEGEDTEFPDETLSPDVEETLREIARFPDIPFRTEALAALAPKYYPVIDALIAREVWPAADVAETARAHGMMHNGMLEQINTWAEENLGDLLILEDGKAGYLLNRDLMAEAEEEMGQ